MRVCAYVCVRARACVDALARAMRSVPFVRACASLSVCLSLSTTVRGLCKHNIRSNTFTSGARYS